MNKLKNTTIVSAIAFTIVTAITLHSISLSNGRKSYEKTVDVCAINAKNRADKTYNSYWGGPDKNPKATGHLKLVKNSGAFYKDNIIHLTSSFTNGVIGK